MNKKYKYFNINLFGSYAKGNYNDESDINIDIVFKNYSILLEMQLEMMRLRKKIDRRIEPHPFKESEFQ